MSTTEAIFTGANRHTNTASKHSTLPLIAYGAGQTIALWDPISDEHKGIHGTLKGHKADITCIQFILSDKENNGLLISGGEDSSVKVWRFVSGSTKDLELVCSLEGHDESITALTSFGDVFVTGDSTGRIIVWKVQPSSSNEVVKLWEFQAVVGVLPLSLALQEVEKGQYVLALGGSKFHIFVYTFQLSDSTVTDFKLDAKLEGHEDWIKALTFKKLSEGDYLLASGSQDKYIRLWRLRLNGLIDRSDEDESKLTLLSNKQYKFSINSTQIAINFEALIMGHDDWVSALQWHSTKLALLASGADTNMMIFEPDTASGIWVTTTQLGEISTKGASTATGSSGGFYCALWFESEDKEYVLTNGKTGAWRKWTRKISDNAEEEAYNGWEQELAVTGSVKACTDLAWAPNGEYLLSTSLDQTTRLYSQWTTNADGTIRPVTTWREFARPQIHGYDMICLTPLSDTRFVSGGDEKILRSFDEPRGVAELLKKFCGVEIQSEEMPESAALPALGLSNKATTDEVSADLQPTAKDYNNRETNDTNNITYSILSTLSSPPLEDHLQRHTLFPEIEKLYGHGYELTTVTSSHDNKLIVSACRSNTVQHATLKIFDAKTWQEKNKPGLRGHELTVTRLRFSPCDQYLLSVSRDRKYAIWKRNLEDDSFELFTMKEKAHSRIIWDCSWAPSQFSQSVNTSGVFVTGSRDKTIKVWKMANGAQTVFVTSAKFDSPVTSVDIHTSVINGKILLAVGLESGAISLYSLNNEFQLDNVYTLDDKETPNGRISRVSWCSKIENNKILLGVGSGDCSVRIYSFGVALV